MLVATTAGAGHFADVLPFAKACVDTGHEVRVAAPASFASSVERAGFRLERLPDVDPGLLGSVFGRLPTLPRQDAKALVVQEVFGNRKTAADQQAGSRTGGMATAVHSATSRSEASRQGWDSSPCSTQGCPSN